MILCRDALRVALFMGECVRQVHAGGGFCFSEEEIDILPQKGVLVDTFMQWDTSKYGFY